MYITAIHLENDKIRNYVTRICRPDVHVKQRLKTKFEVKLIQNTVYLNTLNEDTQSLYHITVVQTYDTIEMRIRASLSEEKTHHHRII